MPMYVHTLVPRSLQSEAHERDLINDIVTPTEIAAEKELRIKWPIRRRLKVAYRVWKALVTSAASCDEYYHSNRVY